MWHNISKYERLLFAVIFSFWLISSFSGKHLYTVGWELFENNSKNAHSSRQVLCIFNFSLSHFLLIPVGIMSNFPIHHQKSPYICEYKTWSQQGKSCQMSILVSVLLLDSKRAFHRKYSLLWTLEWARENCIIILFGQR